MEQNNILNFILSNFEVILTLIGILWAFAVWFPKTTQRIENLEKGQEETNKSLDKLDSRIDKLDDKINKLNDKMDNGFNEVNKQFQELNKSIQGLYNLIVQQNTQGLMINQVHTTVKDAIKESQEELKK